MKNLPQFRLTYLLASFALIFLLSGQAVAVCLSPIMEKMTAGENMACCTQDCRMDETTQQAAQQACEQSQAVLSLDQVMAGPPTVVSKLSITHLPDLGLGASSDLLADQKTPGLSSSAKGYSLPEPRHSAKLYLLIRTLLI